ncbi:phytanoyl-CoA dioxygenase family protein [Sphingomonas flavescens]|uniref:phytanoyl-CoA dioxygenase family protein n=1 Tax=Sphingomonas flavescens TaxID=3132797 RepID=UPI003B228125
MTDLRSIFPGIPYVESPLFERLLGQLDLTVEEARVARDLHERGYAVIDFPDDHIEERIARVQDYLAPRFGEDILDPNTVKEAGHRIQDAWVYNEDVREIAANRQVSNLLAKLYGRPAFPFQTLNFPVGTAQHLHSDSIHFSSIPERFMCGVWLAMEDVHPEAGPLTYLPGSHRWPILSNIMLGRSGWDAPRDKAQQPFEQAWAALVEQSGASQETFLARKGQALIWAANLLHGGSPRLDPKRTRWSQVTHYYFDDCIYYTPAFSDEAVGKYDTRRIVDVATEKLKPNCYLGTPIDAEETASTSLVTRIRRRMRTPAGLPDDFDPGAYYQLNPDVAVAKLDAVTHYLTHGKQEGRRYRYRG